MKRIEAFFNDAKQGHRMSVRRLKAIMEVWRRDGREVEAYAYEDEGPGLGLDLPRFRVIITPPGLKRQIKSRAA